MYKGLRAELRKTVKGIRVDDKVSAEYRLAEGIKRSTGRVCRKTGLEISIRPNSESVLGRMFGFLRQEDIEYHALDNIRKMSDGDGR